MHLVANKQPVSVTVLGSLLGISLVVIGILSLIIVCLIRRYFSLKH